MKVIRRNQNILSKMEVTL